MKTRIIITLTLALGLSGGIDTAWAWQAQLRNPAADGANEVWVSNNRPMKGVDVYLAWFDRDATPERMFKSWQAGGDWRDGLHKVAPQALDLERFEALHLTGLKPECPPEHRCFLAMVAVAHGASPLDAAHWQASALLPLNQRAARDRLPGQTAFLPSDGGSGGLDYREEGGALTTTTSPAPTAPPTADADSSATVTEKPDLFRLEGTQVLYANGQAQRFQVIDVADPSTPRLQASTELPGQPREVYRLGDDYIVLQSGSFNPGGPVIALADTAVAPGPQTEATRISVLRLDGDQLTQHNEYTVEGYFLESRRRGEVIYVVSVDYSLGNGIKITALRAGDGALTPVQDLDVATYNPEVAIFSDYLVVMGHNAEDWRSSVVQVFDLRNPEQPLQALPELTVPGQIPSEFHVDVQDDLLRVVYGPLGRTDNGSTLAIYDLASDLTEVGKVDAIAPGEALFATRFHDQYAYVVTYERIDPLWVIDVSDPSNPVIKGELKVPGWSKKMFFHDDRLFAVGIDDQPLSNEENRVRRVAVSLFDVADPTAPGLLGRFTPLAGEVSYSWSPALDDERALLLDWNEQYRYLNDICVLE